MGVLPRPSATMIAAQILQRRVVKGNCYGHLGSLGKQFDSFAHCWIAMFEHYSPNMRSPLMALIELWVGVPKGSGAQILPRAR